MQAGILHLIDGSSSFAFGSLVWQRPILSPLIPFATRYSLVVAKASTERTRPNDTEMRSRVLCQGSLRATQPVLSMLPCKLKLDEKTPKHASLAQ
jgi:hypothetical protein